MITLAWYLLKVIIASGILCGYYFIALRNKVFHGWNRFYLLASVIISLMVPLLKVNIFQNSTEKESTVINVLQTINANDEAVSIYNNAGETNITSQKVTVFLFALVTFIFLVTFCVTLFKIEALRKKYPVTRLNKINFFSTTAKGTPFSFFNSIFWNISIDVHSRAGQQIFNHELAHIKEKHSFDKLCMNIIMIFFWINPFFWLIRRELNMIHEFIADKKAIEDNDLSSFSEMILHTIYPSQNFTLTNNFFYSPLKRRILMLTKNNNPKVNYLSRLMVLPVAAILFFGFTLHVKNINNVGTPESRSIFKTDKIITVIIDAGHGGSDFGAMSGDKIKEKDINLSIAKKIKGLNTNEHVKIVLTRDNDIYLNPKERVDFTQKNHADLFISIHVNATVENPTSESGFSVLIDKNNSEKNKLLASSLINELQKVYTTQTAISVRKAGVWIIDQNVCPAVLIECGYITNATDKAFIDNSANQDKIAKNILAAINDYTNNASSFKPDEPTLNNNIDTTPAFSYKKRNVKEVSVTPATSKVNITYEDGTKETITEAEARRSGLLMPPPPPAPPVVNLPAPPPPPANPANPKQPPPPPPFPADVVYNIDGKISTVAAARNIDKNDLKSVNILKGNAAINKYGKEAKYGAIEILTIANNQPLYVVDGIEVPYDKLNELDVSNIESINILKDDIAKYGDKAKNGVVYIKTKKIIKDTANNNKIKSAKMIEDGGKLEISYENNKTEILCKTEYEKRGFRYILKNIQLDNPASFPGGNTEWIKYNNTGYPKKYCYTNG